MSSLNANDPYGQATLPYQPSIERIDSILSQQKKAASLRTTQRVGLSQDRPVRPSQTSASPSRISKAEALTIVRRCKKWLIASALAAFAILSALVAGHVAGTTSSQTTPVSNNQIVPSSSGSTTSSPSDGNFFQQQQGGGYGGYGFGNSNSWQPPVSRSRVS